MVFFIKIIIHQIPLQIQKENYDNYIRIKIRLRLWGYEKMKIKQLLIFLLIMATPLLASVSRLYVGELDGQFMAGVDSRIDFNPFFIGGDVRTIIRKTVIGRENKEGELTSDKQDEEKIVGFLPDRTDYKLFFGITFNDHFEIEYAHTCYHRVISSSDNSLYLNNVNPDDTDTITLRFIF